MEQGETEEEEEQRLSPLEEGLGDEGGVLLEEGEEEEGEVEEEEGED